MTTREGCYACAHDQWDGGDRICVQRPHDVGTSEQRAIVRWLTAPCRDAFRDPGCPGFAPGQFTGAAHT